jgi:hypothetical protein
MSWKFYDNQGRLKVLQTAGAPGDAFYLTTQADPALSNERVLGTAVILRGTAASKPASSDFAGQLYVETDGSRIVWRGNGAGGWDEITRGEGGLRLAQLAERDYASLASRTHGNGDHTTGVAPANVTKATAAEGTSAAVARADHKHDVDTGAPVNVTKAAAAEGTSTSLARADHKHDVTTAAPVAQAFGDSAAEGSASSLACSDHRHGMPAEPDKTFRWTHTFAVQGEIKVPSGDTDFIPPFFVSLAAGQTLKLVKARYAINGGTSATVKIQINGADATGFTGISVTTTPDQTDPTDITLADNDKIAIVVTAVSGTPKNLSFTLVFEAVQ